MFKTLLVGAVLCAFLQNGASLLATVSAQERSEVSLLKNGGVYTVPVLINGVIPLQFIVDSGAADIAIPGDVFLTLLRTLAPDRTNQCISNSSATPIPAKTRTPATANPRIRHISAQVSRHSRSAIPGSSKLISCPKKPKRGSVWAGGRYQSLNRLEAPIIALLPEPGDDPRDL
jgi:hypothetical protein